MAGALPLGLAEGQGYQERNWGLLPAFARPEEILRLRADLPALASAAPGPSAPIVYRAGGRAEAPIARIERLYEHLPVLRETGLADRLTRCAEGLLGGKADLFKDKLNFRYPGDVGYAPHQDCAAGWQRFAPRFVTLCLFLDRSHPATGGFEVVDHRTGCGLYPNIQGMMETSLFESLGPQGVHARPGDLLVLGGETPHRTLGNQSRHLVRHLLLTFAGEAVQGARSAYYDEKLRAFHRGEDGVLQFRVFEFR